MTHEDRMKDIQRIRNDVACGVHDFDHTDVEDLLLELDRRQAQIVEYEKLLHRCKALAKIAHACATDRDLCAALSTQAYLVNQTLAACEEETHDAQRTN